MIGTLDITYHMPITQEQTITTRSWRTLFLPRRVRAAVTLHAASAVVDGHTYHAVVEVHAGTIAMFARAVLDAKIIRLIEAGGGR